MSRTKKMIPREPTCEPIRDVRLNRNGVKIGQVIRWRNRIAYISWRNKNHYFIKHRGFGIDKTLLWNMMKEDRVELIIIKYIGERGTRFYLSNIDDWMMNGTDVAYSKEVGDTIETYGSQIVLSEDFMDELMVVN